MGLLLGIDIGTSSLKALLVSPDGDIKAIGSKDYQYDSPRPGYAEQHPDVWWEAFKFAVKTALSKAETDAAAISAVGFSGQMHGIVMLNDKGISVRPAILHCDSRSGAQVQKIKELFPQSDIARLMMNPVYTGFLLPSLLWVKENEPENFSQISCVLMIKDYIRYRLTGVLNTEYSDASATLAFDIKNAKWSAQILERVSLDISLFPNPIDTFDHAGDITDEAAKETGLMPGTVVAAGGGDAVMQGLGNGAVRLEVVTSNIGSSGQICFQSDVPVINPLLTTNMFCGFRRGRFISMGAIMHAGLSFKWLKNILGGVSYSELDAEAAQVPVGSDGLIFLPYLNGERTPHIDPDLSGMFVGLTTATGRGHMVRSVMEGVTFALLECMEVCRSLQLSAAEVVASGGGAKSPLWLQLQADIFGLPVRVAKIQEQAALGAAISAGIAAGMYQDGAEACERLVSYLPNTIEPDMTNHHLYKDYYTLYKDAYVSGKEILKRSALLGRKN